MNEKIILINFTNFSDKQKEEVLNWRNNEKIRTMMVNSSVISYVDHFKFIERLKKDKTKLYFMVSSDADLGFGVINLVNISESSAELGLYRNPFLEKRGIGTVLLNEIILLAKRNKINELKLRVKKDNDRAINLYNKFNFIKVREDTNFIYMEKIL